MENDILMQILETQQAMVKAQTETNQRLDKLETKVDKIETDVAEVKSQVTDTRQRVILMENENKQNFGALFDQGVVLNRKIDRTQVSVDKLQEKQDKHDMHIIRLDAEHEFSV